MLAITPTLVAALASSTPAPPEVAIASLEDVSRDEWIRCGGSALVAAGGCATAAGGWGVLICAGATAIAAANCGDVLEGLLE